MAGAGTRPRRVSRVPDEEAFDQTTAAREHRSAATRADRARTQASRRGAQHGRARAKEAPFRRARPELEFEDPEQQELYEESYRDAHRQTRRELFAGPSGAGGLVHEGAGFVLGVLVWTLALNFLQGGPDQAKAWLKAKFLNETSQPSGNVAGPAAPSSPSSPSHATNAIPSIAGLPLVFAAAPASPAGHA